MTEEQAERATGSTVQFRIATADDEAGLRRLLRENPMAGDVQLSLEREPNYFAASVLEGPESRTIVAIEEGRLVCAGSISARMRYVNGAPMRVGYLGGLRLDRRCGNRISIIRRGYELFRQLHEQGGPSIYLTSIITDNEPARRLLERGLPGMPTYRFIGEFRTLVIRTKRGASEASIPNSRRVGTAHRSGPNRRALPTLRSSLHPAEIVEALNRDLPQFQFAPVWTEDDLESLQSSAGLEVSDFRVAQAENGATAGCATLWDQTRIKQTVVRGYSTRLRRLRPLINCAATILRRPRLPTIGEPISHAFVSHLCSDESQPDMTLPLLEDLAERAHRRGIEHLTVGFDSRDPRLPLLYNRFRPRDYVSRLYVVHWDAEGAKVAEQLDDRLLYPEVALL